MFDPQDLTDDAFLGGQLRILQPRIGYRAATDPVLLAACVPAIPGQSLLDLGCGAGVAGLCVAARVPGLDLAGLELQAAYADLARQNAARNARTFEVHAGDLAAMPAALRRAFDHVIANPPYYAPAGSPSPDAGRDTALRIATPIAVWVDAAARRLAPGGWLTMILATAALPQALAALPTRLGSTALLPLAPREGRAATRIIVQARKGGRGALRLLAPLILHDAAAHDHDRDSYSAETRAVLREGADLYTRFR